MPSFLLILIINLVLMSASYSLLKVFKRPIWFRFIGWFPVFQDQNNFGLFPVLRKLHELSRLFTMLSSQFCPTFQTPFMVLGGTPSRPCIFLSTAILSSLILKTFMTCCSMRRLLNFIFFHFTGIPYMHIFHNPLTASLYSCLLLLLSAPCITSSVAFS